MTETFRQSTDAPITTAVELDPRAVAGFYGDAQHPDARTLDTYRGSGMIVVGGTAEEMHAKLEHKRANAEQTVGRILESMHSLETVHTKADVYMPMDTEGKQQAMFTRVEHYSPKVAPGTEVHPIPAFLRQTIDGSRVLKKIDGVDLTQKQMRDHMTRKTQEVPAWDKQLVGLTSEYLRTEQGKKLTESLGIKSLDTLTPEQAVKLSISFVQAVSKYSRDAAGNPDGKRADGASAMDLLREGMDMKGDPKWEGNGVCRNVAANANLVFDALKENQVPHSMLRNTYATQDFGYDYDGTFVQSRDAVEGMDGGHAWNSFITIGSDGSANITTVDATWALEADADTALDHMDYTVFRSANLVSDLAEQSENENAPLFLTDYFNSLHRVARKEYGYSSPHTRNVEEFIFTKYLEFVGKKPGAVDEKLVQAMPSAVGRSIHSLRENMSEDELKGLQLMVDKGVLDDPRVREILAARQKKSLLSY